MDLREKFLPRVGLPSPDEVPDGRPAYIASKIREIRKNTTSALAGNKGFPVTVHFWGDPREACEAVARELISLGWFVWISDDDGERWLLVSKTDISGLNATWSAVTVDTGA